MVSPRDCRLSLMRKATSRTIPSLSESKSLLSFVPERLRELQYWAQGGSKHGMSGRNEEVSIACVLGARGKSAWHVTSTSESYYPGVEEHDVEFKRHLDHAEENSWVETKGCY